MVDVGAPDRVDHLGLRQVSPGFVMPYFNLGLLLQGAGYRTEAIAAYQRFLELVPGQ